MIPKQIKPLLAQLMEATGDGKIQWHEGADDAYFATQKDANFHIRYIFDGDTGDSGYTFRVMRGESDAFFTVMSHEGEYESMRNLYSSISFNAAGGDAIFKDLFD